MQLTNINGKYELWLPTHRAEREQWQMENGGWEVLRIEEMLKVIKPSDVVFDLGTEEGDISALIAKYSECDMVLFEPNQRVWPCIKAIWDTNGLKMPLFFYGGFVSDKTAARGSYPSFEHIEGSMIPDHGFKQLYENYPDVPQITIDDFCERTRIYPTVITMDVEGSEFNVMKGAEKTLRKRKPIIFMSIHPEFMFDSYRNEGTWKDQLGERQHVVHMLRFIDECGYTHRCIEYDYHELHMVFEPK